MLKSLFLHAIVYLLSMLRTYIFSIETLTNCLQFLQQSGGPVTSQWSCQPVSLLRALSINNSLPFHIKSLLLNNSQWDFSSLEILVVQTQQKLQEADFVIAPFSSTDSLEANTAKTSNTISQLMDTSWNSSAVFTQLKILSG